MRVRPDDAAYRSRAAAEAEFWAQPQWFGVEANASRRDSVLERYVNERFTGDPAMHWYETIPRYGPFRRGLILGASGVRQEQRILEANPQAHFTFVDISSGALENRERDLGGRFGDRFATRQLDMNFAELPAGEYDLIVSSSTLHHVTNLEHAAFQINRALAPGGYLFVQDYTGEARHKLAPEKKAVFEAIHARHARRGRLPAPALEWTDEDESTLSPFCGVRSDEITGVLRAHLVEERLCTADVVIMPMLYSHPADAPAAQRSRLELWRRRAGHIGRRAVARLARKPPVPAIAPEFLRDLLTVDPILCDAGILAPASSFGIYRKRA